MPLSLSRIDKTGQGETANEWSARQNANMTLIEDAVNANELAIQANAFFDTVAAMVATSHNDGAVCQTAGYLAAGDGGGNVYKYYETGRPTADGGFYLDGPGANDYFEAINRTVVRLRQWGMVADGVTDDVVNIRLAMAAAADNNVPLFIDPGEYYFSFAWSGLGANQSLSIIGLDASRTIIRGNAANGLGQAFIRFPASWTGSFYMHGVGLENVYRPFNLSDWTAGPATAIGSFTVRDCQLVEGPSAGSRNFFYTGGGDLLPDHRIERLHFLRNYMEMDEDASAIHVNVNFRVDDLLFEGNTVKGGKTGFQYIPNVNIEDNTNEYMTGPRFLNNVFRDTNHPGGTFTPIYLAAQGAVIRDNLFKNITNTADNVSGFVIYLQSKNSLVEGNRFHNIYMGRENHCIYSKGSPIGHKDILAISRSGNVATVETVINHNYTTNDIVNIDGITAAGFNATGVSITVVDDKTFTYSNSGVDVGRTYDSREGTCYAGVGLREGRGGIIQNNHFYNDDRTRSAGMAVWNSGGPYDIRNNTVENWWHEDGPIIRVKSDGRFDNNNRIVGNRFIKCRTGLHVIGIWYPADNLRIDDNSVESHYAGSTVALVQLLNINSDPVPYRNLSVSGNAWLNNTEDIKYILWIGDGNDVITVDGGRCVGNSLLGSDASTFLIRAQGTAATPLTLKNFTCRKNVTDLQNRPLIFEENLVEYVGCDIDDNYKEAGPVHTASYTTRPEFGDQFIDSTGGAVQLTLSDAYTAGHEISFAMIAGATASTVRVSNHIDGTNVIFTFSAVGDLATFVWNGSVWVTKYLSGATQ